MMWLMSIGEAARRFFEAPSEPSPRRTRTLVSVFESDTGDFVVANMHVVREAQDGKGRYRFFMSDGKILPLDMRGGSYRIVRRKVEE